MTDDAVFTPSEPAPASAAASAPAAGWLGRLRDEPNPIWIRELKQSVRLIRTPAILAVLTSLLTLIIAAIGGLMSSSSSPSKIGAAIFQTYFSLAYAVVTLVGPAVAANAIASEREGRTWEAVVLTGLRPDVIARGKFLAAFTGVGVYIVALAPVGALAFLFGGVTATQVVLAFILLTLIAVLCITFGLAISSAFSNLRIALVLTLLLAVVTSGTAYTMVGVGGSALASEIWPAIGDVPVWLPIAFDRATFGLEYVVLLIATPLIGLIVPAWFFYEVTVANLSSLNADRSWRLKRWLLVSAPLLTAWGLVCTWLLFEKASVSDRLAIIGVAILGMTSFFICCAFLFQSEPLGPSRRVKADYAREGASAMRRFLGPSAVNGATLVLSLGAALLALSGLAWFAMISRPSLAPTSYLPAADPYAAIALFIGYALATHVFMTGAAAFIRVRVASLAASRFVLAGVGFVIAAVPWMVGGITGALSAGMSSPSIAVASPSPFYVIVMIEGMRTTSATPTIVFTSGVACILAYATGGVMLLGLARRRSNAIIAGHDRALAEAEARLAAEDDAMYAAAEEAPVDDPAEPVHEPEPAPSVEPRAPGEPE